VRGDSGWKVSKGPGVGLAICKLSLFAFTLCGSAFGSDLSDLLRGLGTFNSRQHGEDFAWYIDAIQRECRPDGFTPDDILDFRRVLEGQQVPTGFRGAKVTSPIYIEIDASGHGGPSLGTHAHLVVDTDQLKMTSQGTQTNRLRIPSKDSVPGHRILLDPRYDWTGNALLKIKGIYVNARKAAQPLPVFAPLANGAGAQIQIGFGQSHTNFQNSLNACVDRIPCHLKVKACQASNYAPAGFEVATGMLNAVNSHYQAQDAFQRGNLPDYLGYEGLKYGGAGYSIAQAVSAAGIDSALLVSGSTMLMATGAGLLAAAGGWKVGEVLTDNGMNPFMLPAEMAGELYADPCGNFESSARGQIELMKDNPYWGVPMIN
jgi:hypothetical protein